MNEDGRCWYPRCWNGCPYKPEQCDSNPKESSSTVEQNGSPRINEGSNPSFPTKKV